LFILTTDSNVSSEQGLDLADTLSSSDANHLSLAFGSEQMDVLNAEAFIAERQYRKTLITARSYQIKMLRARDKLAKAIAEMQHHRSPASETSTAIQVKSERRAASFQPPTFPLLPVVR
jgi:hypothetical protein